MPFISMCMTAIIHMLDPIVCVGMCVGGEGAIGICSMLNTATLNPVNNFKFLFLSFPFCSNKWR